MSEEMKMKLQEKELELMKEHPATLERLVKNTKIFQNTGSEISGTKAINYE